MACFDAACKGLIYEEYRSRIRGPYVRFCERDEAVTPHPTRLWLHSGLDSIDGVCQ